MAEMAAFKVFPLKEVAPTLGVSYRTLLQYVKDRRLRAVKIGGRWKVSEENLRRFINGDEDERAEELKRENISRSTGRITEAILGA